MYLLSSEMATREIDFLKNSIEHQECEDSTWRKEPVVFVRSERKCVTLHLRDIDNSIEDTKYAIENCLALMCSDRLSTKFNLRRNWEVDFVRFLLGFTTSEEEQQFNTLTKDHYNMCNVTDSMTKRIGKAMTAVLRHGTKWKSIADKKGAIPLANLLDDINYNTNPLTHHAAGRIFAAMINGNDKQRFFVDIYMYDTWFPQEFNMPWDIFIGCHQGHSNLTVTPSEVNHLLTEVECYSLGWIFHVTDKKFERSIYNDGLRRKGRDAMHFMYENNGKSGYVIKGAGTRKPREYDTTIYCVLNVRSLLRAGFELFLSANGVVLIYDDVSLEYIWMVDKYPYLHLCVFHPGVPHSLPREVQYGKWREGTTLRQKYAEYLSADEISKYLDEKGELVEWHMPRDVGRKRRQNAWEFMGQAPPTLYMGCINSLFKESQAEASTGSAPAEGVDVNAAAASTSSPPGEAVDIELELSTMNSQEIQAVRIISENSWHLWQSGVLTLRTVDGKKVENQHCETVTVLREFWKMSESQQRALLFEGVTRHVWERYPLAGHTVFFMTRAWEIGRMTGYVKNYSPVEEQEAFQKELRRNMLYGWLRDIPEPCGEMDESPEAHDWFLIEQEEFVKDQGEVRMFDLFCEAVEDLYTGMIDEFVRKTPALWEEFVMRLPSGEMYLVDPDPSMPVPTVPTAENLCLDIHNNVQFSPRLCLWAIEQKLASTGEVFVPGQFAEYCFNELKQYVNERAHLDDSFYKHLVINTQSRTFEDKNYVNTIGSKVVIKPVGEILELSVKKMKTLQRTMVQTQQAQDSSAMDESGDLSSDKIPVDSMEVAEPAEDLPPGEISTGEAKEEDVEMEEAKEEEEEVPQDEQGEAEVQQQLEEEPDFGDDDEQEYPESELSEGALLRVNELLNSRTYELIGMDGDEEEDDFQAENPRPRVANRAQARFMHNMLREDLQRIDAMLDRERRAREEFHQRSRDQEQHLEEARAAENLPPGETSATPASSSGDLPTGEIPDVQIEQEKVEEQEVTQEVDEEVKMYQEELQCRKEMDIFAKTPTAQFMELLKPETEDQAKAPQKNLENLFVKESVTKTNRPFVNKMTEVLDQPLEPEPRVKIEVPKPEPKGEDGNAQSYECALDELKALDKYHKLETFGFYGKYFRDTHSNALNFVKFRKASPIAHPCAKFDFDERALVSLYCELFYSTPTPDSFFYQKAITYTCEDHRLRLKKDNEMYEGSMRSKEEFEKKKEVLKTKVRQSDDEELGYDDLITDLTELFLSGEDIPRNPESVGSSSKSITTLFWNLGNWNRGLNFRVPAELDYKKLHYKEMNPERYPDHVPEDNNLFMKMVKNFRGHIILNCEASSVVVHKDYIEKNHWKMCFNDATDLCCMARLGVDGKIRQIAGPNEEKSEDIWNGPKRRISWAIFEITWGKAIPRGAFAVSTTGYFSRDDPQDYEEMTRARMSTTRVCVYHVDHDSATKGHQITGECLAHMLYECVVHQVTICAGDANKLAYQKQGNQLDGSFGMSTFQFWLDRFEQTIDAYLKRTISGVCRDLSVRQFHSASFLDLLELKEKLEGKVKIDAQTRADTRELGDCCMMTFFEYGISMQKDGFFDEEQKDKLEYRYSVNEDLFYLTNDILLLREGDKDHHCPLLVTIEPSDLSNQEKKSFQTVESKVNRADKRKAEQKARKAAGKAKAAP